MRLGACRMTIEPERIDSAFPRGGLYSPLNLLTFSGFFLAVMTVPHEPTFDLKVYAQRVYLV
jgi:hypothetical protein